MTLSEMGSPVETARRDRQRDGAGNGGELIYLSAARLPTEKANGYQIMKMCEAFSGEDLRVTLLHPYRRQSSEDLNVSPFTYYGMEPRFGIKTLPGIDWIHLTERLAPWLSPLGFKARSLVHAFRSLRCTRPCWPRRSVYYFSRDLVSTLALLRFRRRIRGKVIYEAHGFPERRPALKIRCLSRLDLLVTINAQLKRMFREAGFPGEKILVAHDAVDIDRFDIDISREEARRRVGLPVERQIAMYVGKFHTMQMEKGIPEIIRAAKFLWKDYPGLVFYFVGGPLERVRVYERLLDGENLPRNRFVFLEKQPIEQVPYFLKASDLLLMPFPGTEYYSYHMSPLKMFEYMASKRPIIATRLPSIMEVLEDRRNSVLCAPDDPEDLARQMRVLLEEDLLVARITRQAHSDVQRNSWRRRVETILACVPISAEVEAPSGR